jgi:hypothetical protein
MFLWGVMWLTCLCGSMEDAWTWNCRLALERNSLGSSIPMIHSLCGCGEYVAADQLDLHF